MATTQQTLGDLLRAKGITTTSANNKQIGGNHYKTPIEPWDYIVANDLGYLEGNIVKYVSRYKNKNGLQDLDKALHYLEKLIEVKTAEEYASEKHISIEDEPF